jgi:hypothetical protein
MFKTLKLLILNYTQLIFLVSFSIKRVVIHLKNHHSKGWTVPLISCTNILAIMRICAKIPQIVKKTTNIFWRICTKCLYEQEPSRFLFFLFDKIFFLQESLVWKNSAHFSQENILPVQYKTFQSGVRAFVSYLKCSKIYLKCAAYLLIRHWGGGGGGGNCSSISIISINLWMTDERNPNILQ